jgi:hypothetical protein
METKRPTLNKDIPVEDFKSFYWLKEELVNFCREIGLSTAGGKIELAGRIAKFLETGIIEGVAQNIKPKKRIFASTANNGVLSLNTVITENYKNSEAHRAFFKSVIGDHFKFTVNFMNYFKNNVGKTYGDALEEWKREHELKKKGLFKTEIGKQFEYNQYFRDFFSDPNNKTKTRKDAIKCWKMKKSLPGDNKYNIQDLEFLKD